MKYYVYIFTAVLFVLPVRGNADDADGLFQRGENVYERDPKAAYVLYEEAAKLGHVGAMESVATCYEQGSGVDIDYAKALAYYEKVARSKSMPGIEGLARIYASCPDSAFHDGKKAVRFASVVARTKPQEAAAQALLAAAYARDHNFSQAQKFARKAAALEPDQYQKLVDSFRKRIPYPAIASEAWLEISAGKGSTWAMCELGALMISGSSSEQETKKGRAWIERAAAKGVNAYELTGDALFEAGKFKMAEEWYDLAMENVYYNTDRSMLPRRVLYRASHPFTANISLRQARKAMGSRTITQHNEHDSYTSDTPGAKYNSETGNYYTTSSYGSGQNYEKALHYLEVAAIQGSSEAREILKTRRAKLDLQVAECHYRYQPDKAMEYVREAVGLGLESCDDLQVCAYIFAELGEYETAAKLQSRAVAIIKNASSSADPNNDAEYRLERYKKGEKAKELNGIRVRVGF